MSDRRKNCSPTPEENRDQTQRVRITQNKLKTNRLKRSPRNTQSQNPDVPNSRAETDFKTPTRVPKFGFRSSVTEESPNSELQHEIIWDSSSPTTPVRNGRGRRRAAVFTSVDISDIVNRIAPKDKRPDETEISLLKWIRDTAIPCTPEIREPRTNKPKPIRQNPLEDLLKLAKQFDYNMIQQEETHHQPNPQSSAEAALEPEPQASPPIHSDPNRPPGLDDAKTNGDDLLDDPFVIQEMDNDLDLLFDGSTQQVSGGLSPAFSTGSESVAKLGPQCEANHAADSESVRGDTKVGGASDCKNAQVCTLKQAGVGDDFDDDWNDDGLLDDSLVMEMTQNPELFSAPHCSSTQKPANTSSGHTVYHQSGDKAKPECGQRGRNWNEATRNSWQSGFRAKHNQETQVFPATLPGSHGAPQTFTQPKQSPEILTTHANSTWRVQSASTTALASTSEPSRSLPSSTPNFRISSVTNEDEKHPDSEHILGDLASEDLDSIFASDDIWGDGADDDNLFCEACEKVEGSMVGLEPLPKTSVSKPTRQSARLQSHQNTRCNQQSAPVQPTPSRIYNRSGADGKRTSSSSELLPGAQKNNNIATLDHSVSRSRDRGYKFTRVTSTMGTGSGDYKAVRHVGESNATATVQSHRRIQDGNQILKPYSNFSVAPAITKDANKAVVTRCSDAEIERKKQQAMERRRLRMLASQNVHGPT